MKHSTKLLVIIATAVSTIAFAGAGWAYWTTTGTGSASGRAGTLNAPTITTATWSGSTGNVTVGWTAPSSGAVPSGYYVRRDGGNVCGSPAGPLTAMTCIDSDVPGDSHTYTVTAVFNSWTAPASTSVVVTPNVAIPSGQSVAVGGTIAATLHGFRSVDTIAFRLDNATGTAITTRVPASVTTPAGSGSATATLTIPAGATPGTHTIYAAGSLGDSATSTNTFTVTVTASKFAFTSTAVSGPASASATLGPITVQAQDASGTPVNAGAGGIPVTLTSNSTGTKFFAASSGGSSVGSVTIPSGSSTVSFYYADTKSGSPVITASGTLTSATQTETITAGPASALCFIGATSCTANYSVALSGTKTFPVGMVDAFGNAATQTVNVVINVTRSSGANQGGSVSPTGSQTITIENSQAPSSITVTGDSNGSSHTTTATATWFSGGTNLGSVTLSVTTP